MSATCKHDTSAAFCWECKDEEIGRLQDRLSVAGDPGEGPAEMLLHFRDRAADLERAILCIIEADARGQGIPFAEAMKYANGLIDGPSEKLLRAWANGAPFDRSFKGALAMPTAGFGVNCRYCASPVSDGKDHETAGECGEARDAFGTNRNEYTPWVEEGITEGAYWKRRYIESREEVAEVERRMANTTDSGDRERKALRAEVLGSDREAERRIADVANSMQAKHNREMAEIREQLQNEQASGARQYEKRMEFEREITALRAEVERLKANDRSVAAAWCKSADELRAEVEALKEDLQHAASLGTDAVRVLRARIAELEAQLAEQTDGLVCACGCPWDDHEVIDSEGYACEHDDHECIQCWPAVLAMLQGLRARVAELEGRLRATAGCGAVSYDGLHCQRSYGHKDHPGDSHETTQGALICWPESERDPEKSAARESKINASL